MAREGRRKRRRWTRLLLMAGLVGAAYASLMCVRPASFKAVREPRDGRAMAGRVALVYSSNYQIELGGAERLHSFDIRKYARIDMHESDIYPVPKETCTLDVELQRGTDDAEYLRLLGSHLPGVFERSRPDLLFLQAGVDTLAGDPLAHLAMTRDGIVQRDAMVIDECVRRGVPVVMVLGGGYSPGAWSAQFASIRRTIETYGLSGRRPYPPRGPTVKEKLYVK